MVFSRLALYCHCTYGNEIVGQYEPPTEGLATSAGILLCMISELKCV